MDNELVAIAAVVVASVASILAGIQRAVVLALGFAALALFALADVVKGL